MNPEFDWEDIRKAHDIHSVLGLNAFKKTIVCPLPMQSHASNTPSFSIFWKYGVHQQFKCHGNGGAHGDVIDLVGYMSIAG